MIHQFHKDNREAYRRILETHQRAIPVADRLRIDLHCHDHNSDVPDELLGRILRLPETWLSTGALQRCLAQNGTDIMTVTNHNNARSCWQLMEKGRDVLPGAEFTCTFTDSDVQIHVLTYGFTPRQEERLKVLRRNLFRFLEYTCDHDLPTVLPHPLYFYNPSNRPTLDICDKLALMFERFEVLNGQRDTWQNLLTAAWIESLDEEKLEALGKKHEIPPGRFCRKPYIKRFTGGSDDHMGLFAGSCGTLLHVPNLKKQKKMRPLSHIALDALLYGPTAPYGVVAEEEKLNIALLDYFCQIALHMEDPGLIRMFLHRGSLKDKLLCLAVSNGMQELKRHRYTMRFLQTFHESLSGKSPNWLYARSAGKDFRPMVDLIERIANSRKKGPDHFLEVVKETIPELSGRMNTLLAARLKKNLTDHFGPSSRNPGRPDELVRKFELPSHLRKLFQGGSAERADMAFLNLSEVGDNLSFPLLASAVMLGSAFASQKALHKNRDLLNAVTQSLGKHQHPRRVLWLTDTFYDRNGVSTVLQDVLAEVRNADLPIDFLTCGPEHKVEPHLIQLEPLTTFTVPQFGDHLFRVPDPHRLLKIFWEGGYDRIVCSTELAMGLAGLFLGSAFSAPVYFYMHTDWLDFFEKNTELGIKGIDRVRRLMRAYYKCFDGIFVLNEEHEHWLTGSSMGIQKERVYRTAHWVDDRFRPAERSSPDMAHIPEDRPVLLFAGRLSEEKGVMDLVGIYKRVRAAVPDTQLVLAGTGPSESGLRTALPEAHFLGWVDRDRLPVLYSRADLLALPSRFDTFGCVVLEAMSCGCPVVAYDTKGPRDLIDHGQNGFLASGPDQMADQIIRYFQDPDRHLVARVSALERARSFQPHPIMRDLLRKVGIFPGEPHRLKMRVTTETDNSFTPKGPETLIADLLDVVSS